MSDFCMILNGDRTPQDHSGYDSYLSPETEQVQRMSWGNPIAPQAGNMRSLFKPRS